MNAIRGAHARAAVGLLVATLAAACSTSAPSSFYTLAALAAPAADARFAQATVAVSAVTIPGTLDRPQMVRFASDERVVVSEQERWAEPLAHAIGRTLAEDLRSRLGDALVAAYPQDASATARYRITVDFSHLDVRSDGAVLLDAQWSIRDVGAPVNTRAAGVAATPAAVPSVAGHSAYTAPAQGAGAAAAVAAQNQALAHLADDLAAALRSMAAAS